MCYLSGISSDITGSSMHKFIRFLLIGVFLVHSQIVSAQADTVSQVSFKQYFNATCDQYTGTWQGFITDPTDLFGNGEAWPVTVYLYVKEGQLVGKTSTITSKGNTIQSTKKLWADCKSGVLTQIIWGEKGECGGVSNQGMLVAKDVLLLQLAWENAMNGTTFYTFLHRQNNQYPFAPPANKAAYHFGDRNTCH
jgi:hypothetical protein